MLKFECDKCNRDITINTDNGVELYYRTVEHYWMVHGVRAWTDQFETFELFRNQSVFKDIDISAKPIKTDCSMFKPTPKVVGNACDINMSPTRRKFIIDKVLGKEE